MLHFHMLVKVIKIKNLFQIYLPLTTVAGLIANIQVNYNEIITERNKRNKERKKKLL